MTLTSIPLLSQYDLIVIGSGPAGQRAAVQAAKLKKSVLVIEREKIGGSCLHTGTVPSKTLREAALECAKEGSNSLLDVMKRKENVIQGEVSVIQAQLTRNHVHFIEGTATFRTSTQIEVITTTGKKVFDGKYIIIATGTRPTRQADVPFNDKNVFDSDTVLNMPTLPKTLAILGAGVIGCEYASIFARLGVKVTLFDRRTSLLRNVDEDIVSQLAKHFKNSAMRVELGIDFKGIELDKTSNQVLFKMGDKVEKYDAVLYCMGRIGNSEELQLEKAGIKACERGYLKVNSNYQTSVGNVFAVGDIIGAPGLAASSSEQGRLASNYIFTKEECHFPKTFPYGIYTIPEISSVGMQETDLIKQKIPYVVGRAYYRELARGKILNDEHGFLKLLVHKETGKLLGVHILGTHATELVHIGQVAMACNANIDFLVENVFNYPTLAEAYKVAAYNAYNQMRN